MEEIYNLFFYAEKTTILQLGVVVHHMSGSDEEKIKFLQSHLNEDSQISLRYDVPKKLVNEKGNFTNEDMLSLMRVGRGIEVFEEILLELKSSPSPLTVVTPVVDGKVKYDIQTGLDSIPLSKFQDHPLTGAGVMSDYLEDYIIGGKLDIGSLIYDDHYAAVKALFNAKHYLSSLKLMVSFIDTLGFLDAGEIKSNVFVLWLNNYSNILEELGVSAEELWELRNAILHMTNLDSKKVKRGKVRRISFMVAPKGTPLKLDYDVVYFNLSDLIFSVQKAIKNWLNSYANDPTKLAAFVKRYDRVLSDSRMAKMS